MEELINTLGMNQLGEWSFNRVLPGGQASTSAIYENRSKQTIVVKMLFCPRNKPELRMFSDEVNTLKILCSNSPCYSPQLVIDFTQHCGMPIYYYAVEFIQGRDLKSIIDINPLPWDWEKALQILSRISCALCGFDSRFIHRDLHPGNIIIMNGFTLDAKGRDYEEPGVRILDYGCSKDMLSDFLRGGEEYKNYFRHYGALSTWSPEFINAPDSVKHSHDSWALGVLLYRLLTNEYIVEVKSFGELLEKYRHPEYIREKIEKLEVPLIIIKLLMRALDTDPSSRLNPNEVYYTCMDILYTDLRSENPEFMDLYFSFGCEVSYCPYCNRYIGRMHSSRCPHCHVSYDPFDTVSVLKKV